MKHLKIFVLFAYNAFRARLSGWRYPLVQRNFKPMRFRAAIDRAESFYHTKLRHSDLQKFLAKRGRDTVLIAEATSEHLWINVHLAHILTPEELLGPCHQRAHNPLRGLDGTFTFLAEGGDIRKPIRKLPAYYLTTEPVMSFKVAWTRNEQAYLRDLMELEGPYLNSDNFDLDDYLTNSERTRAVM